MANKAKKDFLEVKKDVEDEMINKILNYLRTGSMECLVNNKPGSYMTAYTSTQTFADIGDEDFFFSRKPVYTDLIKYCQHNAAWYMIYNLEHSEKEEDKKQAFMCTKILAEEFNDASAYQLLACYYYDGIGVEKSYEPVYSLMKKAAELGSESAKEWIEKKYSAI